MTGVRKLVAEIGNYAVRRLVPALVLIALAGAADAPASAQGATPPTAKPGAKPTTKPGGKKDEPFILMRADDVTFDRNTGISTARGKVEIGQGTRILRADVVSYDERSDTVTATGNVVILEPSGEVIFAETAKLTDGMKDATVKSFRMLFTDNSRLAAAGGQRVGGIVTTLNNAVFSPCELCKKDPTKAPLWRVTAARVIHDSKDRQIEYKDAFLEFYGVPVFYLPYFSHPDPSVKRRSGFLAPSYSNDSEFGNVLEVPYFWEISPSEDITLAPRFIAKEASVLAGEYRRRFATGEVTLDASITNPDKRADGEIVPGSEVRGHLRANGRFDIDPIWRTKFQVERASDDTYLRRYKFGEPTNQSLTTSATIEGFRGRNYSQLSGYYFQGLREQDDPGKTPLVLPFAEYNFVSRPKYAGSFLTADTSLLGLHRDEGSDSRRLSFRGGWHLPKTTDSGEVISLSATVQTDAYWVNDVAVGGTTEDGFTGRIFPQLKAQWSYPMVRQASRSSQFIEPVAAVVIAPNGGNPDKIPNEDSQDFEFDDTNLFSSNRFTGVDRVEGGQRFVYGVNWGLYGAKGGAVEAFLGQNLRLQKESSFAPGSGLDEQVSDIVGRLRIQPADYLDFLYRFRVDPDGFEFSRNEVSLAAGPPGFRLGANYLFVAGLTGTGEFPDREELSVGLTARLSEFWTASANIREDLTSTGGTISEGIGVKYEDECFIFDTTFTRSFTSDRDLRPTNTLFFRFIFKHLGEFGNAG